VSLKTVESEDEDGLRLAEAEGVLGGMTLARLDDENRNQFRIPHAVEHGLVVIDVARGSPASRTGFRPGDVIQEINRKPVEGVAEFREAYERTEGTLLLLVRRGDNTLFVALPKEG
jgi:S1-C subfamily serine protease